MLIHGKLILTSSGLLLDEVKSLLQKSLRRKDVDLVTRAAKELHGRDKDQLTWKSMVTFLFEDHCLNGTEVLEKFRHLHGRKDKYGCIELLLTHCYTCRLAACLPVIAMDSKYDPLDWDTALVMDEEYQGLLVKGSSRIDFELLLQHLKNAWTEKESKKIITYMKMATMIVDHDKSSLTEKGTQYCLFSDKVKKNNVSALVLTILSKLCSKMGNHSMAGYTRNCCYLTTIPDVPARLILFAAAAHYIHCDLVKHHKDLPVGKIDWKAVPKLDEMPSWAVDKHTFRGKLGKGTTHILKKPDAKRLTEAELEEFHGVRPHQDINHFFTEGVFCNREVMDHNPYWEKCKDLYLQRPKKLQKTIRMTAVYYDEQLKRFPGIRGIQKAPNTSTKTSAKRSFEKMNDGVNADEVKPAHVTRKFLKLDATVDTGTTSVKSQSVTPSTSQSTKPQTKASSLVIQEVETSDEPAQDGPLLQLPTGSAKMYTRADLKNKVVWKGPYKEDRVKLVMFLHRVLREVFKDPHTLEIQRNGLYVRFPLHHSADASMTITTRDFYDCIGKQQVQGGQFVHREHLGVIQLHNLPCDKFARLPASFWCHYMFRYLLNVGDSGLYNSITDKSLSFLYGIDLEEVRKNVVANDLTNLMFVKLPKKDICVELRRCFNGLKKEMIDIMGKDYDLPKILALAKFYGITFQSGQLEDRLQKIKQALDRV